jgi:hypothetical protein
MLKETEKMKLQRNTSKLKNLNMHYIQYMDLMNYSSYHVLNCNMFLYRRAILRV